MQVICIFIIQGIEKRFSERVGLPFVRLSAGFVRNSLKHPHALQRRWIIFLRDYGKPKAQNLSMLCGVRLKEKKRTRANTSSERLKHESDPVIFLFNARGSVFRSGCINWCWIRHKGSAHGFWSREPNCDGFSLESSSRSVEFRFRRLLTGRSLSVCLFPEHRLVGVSQGPQISAHEAETCGWECGPDETL